MPTDGSGGRLWERAILVTIGTVSLGWFAAGVASGGVAGYAIAAVGAVTILGIMSLADVDTSPR